MWVLASNTMAIFLIVLIGIISRAIVWTWRKWQNSYTKSGSAVQIIPKSTIRSSPIENTQHEIVNDKSTHNLSILSSNRLPEESKHSFSKRVPSVHISYTRDMS